jgi:hypothetical protein
MELREIQRLDRGVRSSIAGDPVSGGERLSM